MRMLRIAIVAASLLAWAAPAQAAWTQGATGGGVAKALSMPQGAVPAATKSNRDVSLSWSAVTLANGTAVSGYQVTRYDASGTAQAASGACAGTVTALSCTETGLPAGSWTYSVRAVYGPWTGADSAKSSAVEISAPTFSLSSSSVTSLPASLSGSLANFKSGQTVTYRLDDPTTGTLLTATTSPSPVPSSGSATVSVTIPAGTSNGDHVVYAIGSDGDSASAPVNVAVPVPVSATVSPSVWDVRDSSSGTEANASDALSFSGDNRTAASGAFPTAFSTSRYAEFKYEAPIPAGVTLSNSAFNVRFAAAAGGDTACFYFEARRSSTGEVLGTYGSAATPVGCVTGTALVSSSTPMPQVTSSDQARDLSIRVYVRSSGSRGITVDLATVSSTALDHNYTIYERSTTDASSGTPTVYPWGLATASDNAFYTSAANWTSAFATTRYLRFAFPAVAPASGTITGATFSHSYRSASTGTTCHYFEIYSGTTLIGTRGSAASPYSCNSSTTASVTDSVSMAEVNTVARANSLVIKMFVRNSGSSTSRHDLARLDLTYSR